MDKGQITGDQFDGMRLVILVECEYVKEKEERVGYYPNAKLE